LSAPVVKAIKGSSVVARPHKSNVPRHELHVMTAVNMLALIAPQSWSTDFVM